MTTRDIAPIVAIALAILVASRAGAQDVPRRAIATRFENGVPQVDLDAADLADAALVQRLESGLPQTLVTRVYAYQGGASTPVAIGVRSCRVTHDPWALTYRVQIQTATSDRAETMSSIGAVMAACLELHALPIGRARDWVSTSGTRVWFGVIIELNPISPDTVHRIRRWLARPDGAAMDGDAFFGSFVSLFVNRSIGEADRTFQFRSEGEVRCP